MKYVLLNISYKCTSTPSQESNTGLPEQVIEGRVLKSSSVPAPRVLQMILLHRKHT